jgi:hypothetical protein
MDRKSMGIVLLGFAVVPEHNHPGVPIVNTDWCETYEPPREFISGCNKG